VVQETELLASIKNNVQVDFAVRIKRILMETVLARLVTTTEITMGSMMNQIIARTPITLPSLIWMETVGETLVTVTGTVMEIQTPMITAQTPIIPLNLI
jgi:hypothetical protein